MRILFICKYNRFRSRIAEILFKKINKNKKYKAESAGLIRGKYPLDKNEIAGAKSLGIKLSGRPRGLSTALLMKADVIVIAADNVPVKIFEARKCGRKLIVWKIPDVKKNRRKEIVKIIKTIENKVKKFVEGLK